MKKLLIALAGGTVLLVGIALLVLPGPGLPIVAAGLAILVTECFWARRAWRKPKGTAARARRKTGLRDWLRRTRAAGTWASTSGTWRRSSRELNCARLN